ncbi:MAG: VWA domain-containing protein [Planctomycetes bacterium]|nr:VWA domain-containing protein [Planctomycetota bacterium]
MSTESLVTEPRNTAAKTGRLRALAWCGVLLLAAGTWLALPRTSAASQKPPLAVLLIDVSKSAVAPAAGTFRAYTRARLEEWLASRQTEGFDVAVVVFGREVRAAFEPATPSACLDALQAGRFDPLRELAQADAQSGASETRLAGALDLARVWIGERSQARVTIFGDGTFTGPDPAALAARLAAEGVQLEISQPERKAWNFALAPLTLPRELEVGAPLVASTEVRSDAAAGPAPGVQVEFRLAGERIRVPVDVAPDGRVPVHVDLGAARAGLIEISARVMTTSGVPDAIVEDDTARATVRCRGSIVVGVVDPERSSAAAFELLAQSGAGIDVVALRSDELATRIGTFDLVVTLEDDLTPLRQRVLASYVLQGGNWLDLAGAQWIGARAAADSALAPLAALAPARNAQPARDVVFLIDASGSMSGEPFAAVRARLCSLVDAALPADDVTVRFFASDLSEPIRFGDGQARADVKLRSDAEARVGSARAPGGATKLWNALEQLARERSGSERETLLLLLSDGREPDRTNFEARASALRAAHKRARIHTCAVAPTADADREFLAAISESTAELAPGQDWEVVFKRAVLERGLQRAARMPVVAVAADSEPAATLTRALNHLPDIECAVRAEITPGAVVLLTDEHGAPLAALARRGRGLVASLAFVPGSTWAPAWDDPRTIAPLVRALARTRAAEDLAPHLRAEGERLILAHPPSDWPAPIRARAQRSNGDAFEFTFDAGEPGFDPRGTRTAPWPNDLAVKDGVALIQLAGAPDHSVDLTLEVPRASEFAFAPRRFTPPAPHASAPRAHPEPAPHPLFRLSLAAGVLALAVAACLGAFSARRA